MRGLTNPKKSWLSVLLLAAAGSVISFTEAAAGPAQALSQKPARVASLNICTDELLLRLAPLSRIASVTWLSREPEESNVADLAARVPVNHGLAEEIIPLTPDLVIAGAFTARMAVALLKRTHVPVAEFDVPPNDIASVRTQIRQMAALLQERDRGEQLIDDIDRRLAAIGPVNSTGRPRALVLNPNGYIAGPGTLVDEVFTRAGLDNVAAHMDLGNYQQVPLEKLVNESVDVLIVNASSDGPPALATELLHHPILAQLGSHTHIVVLPSRLWSCAGPGVVDAIERLKAVADDIRSHRTSR